MDCPLESLSAYLEGALPEDRREDVETHALSCIACRETLRALGTPKPQTFIHWKVAAAAILVLAGLWLWRSSPPPVVAAPSRPPAPEVSETLAGRSVLLSLRPGGRLDREGEVWVLRRGLLRAESPGEPCRLRIGSLEVELLEGVLLAEAGAASGSSILREASAGEEKCRLTLLSGKARILGNILSAPASIGPPLAWKDEGWRSLEEPFLPAPPAAYVLEALVRKRDATAELGVILGGREFAAGAGFLPPGEGWSRLRVSVDPRRIRASLGSAEFLSISTENRPGPACIKAWGGAIEVRQARWRPLP